MNIPHGPWCSRDDRDNNLRLKYSQTLRLWYSGKLGTMVLFVDAHAGDHESQQRTQVNCRVAVRWPGLGVTVDPKALATFGEQAWKTEM